MEKIVKLLDELKQELQKMHTASEQSTNQIDLEALAVSVSEQISYQRIAENLDEDTIANRINYQGIAERLCEETIADYVSNVIEIDHDDLADRIDLDDLSSRLDYREIDVDHLDLAQRIDFQKVAQNIEARDVAESINIKDVAEEIDLDDLSERLDYKLELSIKNINEALDFRKNHIKDIAKAIDTDEVAVHLSTYVDYKKLAKEILTELKVGQK
jgi:hypothetical protein